MKSFLIFFLLSIMMSSMVSAHEFWLEPLDFGIQLNEKLKAHEKVGESFKGNEYAYLSSSYEKFDITVDGKTRPIESRLGDLPAVNEKIEKEGLVILSAATTPSDLTYKTKEKFEIFLRNQGLEWVIERHKERGLPEKGFKEIYRRFPKSLVKVGHAHGNDKRLGLPLEIVLETNPYSELTSLIKAQLLWQGRPLPNKRVNIFNRRFNDDSQLLQNTTLIETHLITDLKGRIEIPRENGGIFLVSAVHMIEPHSEKKPKMNEGDVTTPVWESLWASMTYRIDETK